MARIARLVVLGIPHHITQRGNRRETTFFEAEDYRLYRSLLGAAAVKAGVEIWAYCLMPNHVHVIATPRDPDGLRKTFGELHRRYTSHINARNRWTGHLWQARFGSVAMDEDHLAAAIRYVSLNPVRSRLVARTEDWPWSSVTAHLSGQNDGVVTVAPALARVGSFAEFCKKASMRMPPSHRCGRERRREGRSVAKAGLRGSSANSSALLRRASVAQRLRSGRRWAEQIYLVNCPRNTP